MRDESIFIICSVCTSTDANDVSITLSPLPSLVVFSPSNTSHIFSLSSIQDNITEGTECLSFVLESLNGDLLIVVDHSTITICIQDDDRESHNNLKRVDFSLHTPMLMNFINVATVCIFSGLLIYQSSLFLSRSTTAIWVCKSNYLCG